MVPSTQGARAAGLVTQMAVSTLFFGWAGTRLDEWLSTDPWLMTAGFVLGFTAGMATLLHSLARLEPDDDDEPPDSP